MSSKHRVEHKFMTRKSQVSIIKEWLHYREPKKLVFALSTNISIKTIIYELLENSDFHKIKTLILHVEKQSQSCAESYY